MQAIKLELSKKVGKIGVLRDLNSRFRPGRRLDDNTFAITRCTDISVAQNIPLWIAFIDIKGAYDNEKGNFYGIFSSTEAQMTISQSCSGRYIETTEYKFYGEAENV